MKVIVFGGSGFVGENVADALTDLGHQVTIFDVHKKAELKGNQRFIAGDITSASDVSEAIRGHDYVYNFAGIADIDEAQRRPTETISVNILGNAHILDAALKHQIKKYIFASTIYVYSESGGFYRCSKQACELYVEEYHRSFKLPYNILRYGTLYGAGANKFNSVRKYLHQALTRGEIVCDGSGDELREYINIKDAARISAKMIDAQYNNQNFIVTGYQQFKLHDLFSMIKEILQKDIHIVFKPHDKTHHYKLTPYSYTPKAGFKFFDDQYLDMGQGLIECLEEINSSVSIYT